MPEMIDDEKEEKAQELAAFLESYEMHYEGAVKDLLAEGKIESEPSPQEREKLLKAAKADYENEPMLHDLIPKVCPRLLTEYWKEEIKIYNKTARQDRSRWEKEKAFGRYAPEIVLKNPIPERPTGEKDATPKQIKYLKKLGLRDKNVLKALGTRQASTLIDEILELRDKANVGTEDNTRGVSTKPRSRATVRQSSKSGFFVVVSVIILILVVLGLCAKWFH